MKQFIGLLFLFIPLATAQGQDAVGTSTVTFGLGAGKPFNSYYATSGGPQTNGSYEYRFRKHWAMEFGVDTTHVRSQTETLTTTEVPGSTVLGGATTLTYTYSYSYGTRSALATTMPFGFRGILPLGQGKLELFAGGGGTYLWNPSTSDGWGWQANAGARVAIDKQRRFWLGTTGRYTHANSAYPSQWIVWSADLGFRFGGGR